MRSVAIYKLDQYGNKVARYKTSIEASKANNTSQSIISRCANTVSKSILNNESIIVRSKDVYVKEEDYLKYKYKIIWLLTKEDILVINDEGCIVNVFKNIEQATKFYQGGVKAKNTISRVLNVIDRTAYNYRYATKEHYINMIKIDALCYHREYDNSGGLKKIPVEMYEFSTGKYIKGFNSLTEASEYMGCSLEYIRQAIKKGGPILKTDYCFKERKEI